MREQVKVGEGLISEAGEVGRGQVVCVCVLLDGALSGMGWRVSRREVMSSIWVICRPFPSQYFKGSSGFGSVCPTGPSVMVSRTLGKREVACGDKNTSPPKTKQNNPQAQPSWKDCLVQGEPYR